jgi:hypothetical protein
MSADEWTNEARLAAGLLQIAVIAMPGSYFQSDSRCALAREVLSKCGISEREALEANLALPGHRPGNR